MKTTVDIDEKLLKEAKRISNIRTKKELINFCLKEFIRKKNIERIVKKLGNFPLDLTLKELEKMRKDEN